MPSKFTRSVVVAVAVLSSVAFAQNDNENVPQKQKIVVETNTGRYGVGAEKLDPKQLGVAIYPGAKVAESKGNDSKDNGGHLFLDWGKDSTHLYVQKYISSDSVDNVVSFYRKQLSKYGAVQQCRGGKPVPADAAKLKCDNGDDDNNVQLKVGPERKQHIVDVTPTASGTEFAIVYLDQAKSNE